MYSRVYIVLSLEVDTTTKSAAGKPFNYLGLNNLTPLSSTLSQPEADDYISRTLGAQQYS